MVYSYLVDELLALVAGQCVPAALLLDLDELRKHLDLYALAEVLDELDVDIGFEERGADRLEGRVERLVVGREVS